MLNTIMVPLDGSAFAERALPLAVSLAEKSRARLHLVHALDLLGRPEYATDVPAVEWWGGGARDRAHAYLLELSNRISDTTSLQVSATVLDPPVVQNLVEYAHDADLIVMATHGAGPLRRVWLGSTGDQLARNAPCPVLFLRLHDEEAPLPEIARWGHILVPLDGSRMAESILPFAAELARLHDARLTLLHAVQPLIADFAVAPMVVGMEPVLPPELQQEQVRPEFARMEMLAEQLCAAGVRTDATMLVSDLPITSTILHFTRDRSVDLIALTTHGRGGFERLMLGSVSHHLIRHAGCPVLIMRPDAAAPAVAAHIAHEYQQ